MSTLFASVSGPIHNSLQHIADKWAAVKLDGKVTVQELVTFVQDAIFEAMVAVKPLADDAVKKKLVMELAEYLYRQFLPFLKQTWFGWLWSFFGEDALKQRFLDSISLLIEIFYNASFKPKAA